ncbi:type 2 lanthipeptide synthetase LanM [Macrococcus capreoli]
MNELIKRLYNENYLDGCNKVLDELYRKFSDIISKEFDKNIVYNESQYFKTLIMRYLVVNFQESFSDKPKSNKKDKYLKEFINNFEIDQHIVLKENIQRQIDIYRKYILKIMSLFKKDIGFFNKDNLKINNIIMHLGDSHNDGQSVALIHFESGLKLLFKPKKLIHDKIYFECLININSCLDVTYEYPEIILRDDYSWQSFIEHRECESKYELEKYYYSLGVQSFLLYLLNANDMHFENLIANRSNPVFIDLETLFQTPANINSEFYPYDNTDSSILNTLLFDFSDKESIMTLIGGTTNRKNLPIYNISMINEDNDSISLVESTEKYVANPPNIPLDMMGNSVEIYEKTKPFLKGFSDSYKSVLNNPRMITEVLNKYNDFEIRIVLRPTTVYINYIEYFKQMEDEDDQEILKILTESIEYYKDYEKIAVHEFNTLKNFDVPYFKVDLNSKSIKSVDNKLEIKNFFKFTPKKNFELKLSKLSVLDLERQIMILKLAIAAYREKIDNTEVFHPLRKEIPSNIHQEMKGINEYINTKYPIYNIQLNLEGNTDLIPISYDLYFGLSGISLLFLQYSKKYNDVTYSEKALNLHDTIYHMWLVDDSDNYSAFHGKFSYFKYVLILNKHFKFNINFQEELELMIRKYIDYLDKNINYSIDYLGGLSGIISLLIDFQSSYKELYYIEESIIILMKKLLSHYKFNEDGNIRWKSDIEDNGMKIGLAHGTSGILLTLVKYNDIFSDKYINEVIYKTIQFENNQIYNSDIGWIWCNGLTGLTLVRNILSLYSNEIKDLKVNCFNKKLENEYKLCDGKESICHGTNGNILVLKTLGLNIDYNSILNYEWSSGYNYPNENLSFFLGKVGQLFNLISSNTDKQLIVDILT